MNVYIIQEDIYNLKWFLKNNPDLNIVVLQISTGTIGILAENIPTKFIKIRSKNKYKLVEIISKGDVKSVFSKLNYYHITKLSPFFEYTFNNYVGELSGDCIVLNNKTKQNLIDLFCSFTNILELKLNN